MYPKKQNLELQIIFSALPTLHLVLWHFHSFMSLKRVVLISSQVKGKDSRPKFFIQFLCLMGEKIQKVKKPEVRKKIYLISCIEILHRIKMSHFVWARTKWVYSSLKCKIASYTSSYSRAVSSVFLQVSFWHGSSVQVPLWIPVNTEHWCFCKKPTSQ